jgi:TonB family protein
VVMANATLQGNANGLALEVLRDSTPVPAPVPSKTTVPRARPTEGAPRGRKPADTAEQVETWIPTLPRSTVVRLDSVVGALAARPIADPLPIKLTSAPDNRVRPTTAESESVNAPQRARLIGSLPKPNYPAHLLLAKVGGEVLVRFQVDTGGRPVMSTFSVVRSPDAALTAAVRRVVPTMRFEPARSPVPDSKAITDVMQIGFRFSPESQE